VIDRQTARSPTSVADLTLAIYLVGAGMVVLEKMTWS
jgi:hypothetical protein